MEHPDGLGGQRQHALLISFAEDADVPIGQVEIFEPEIQGLPGAQAIEQHQGDQGEIPRGMKLPQNLATSSAESGLIMRCGCLRRSPEAIRRCGRP